MPTSCRVTLDFKCQKVPAPVSAITPKMDFPALQPPHFPPSAMQSTCYVLLLSCAVLGVRLCFAPFDGNTDNAAPR